MANFMEQEHWERHRRQMRMIYKKKHDILLRSVETYFGKRAVVSGHGAGLHVVPMLPDTLHSEAAIIDRAGQKGIQPFPLSEFYVVGQPEATTLLLRFGGMNSSEVKQGITIVSKIC